MLDPRKQRVNKLCAKLADSRFDALLINQVENVRYLSGFENSDPNVAFLIITQSDKYLITDYRYSQQAEKECPGFEIIERDRQKVSLGQQFELVCKQHNIRTLAFERNAMGYGMLKDIAAALKNIQLEAFAGWVEALRMIKDEFEISALKRAAAIADNTLAKLVEQMRPGMTEKDIALELEYQIQKAGSEGFAFATIMLAGERTSLPHGMPSEKTLDPGDLVTIDFGAVVDGYRSDMTRAFVVGEPSARQLQVYNTVKLAQQAGIEAVKAGIKGNIPYFASERVLSASEFAQHQGEGLGHGVGLFLHEQPFLGPQCDILLEENMVITIEPGIYIPGWGGIRIEDDVIVTEDGCEIITKAPRDLIRIG
ncbi:Xaa-Pro peptidase family protein [Aliikangiella sp. G2MR2-5]|uniref:M24 family metallopeptidase n=1 Tax=Aliikangiella sp. G2MR2-5 TaxID=2788943 RepID=UPI0018A8C45F|nr:Xaa-Pro peptidase family protein [Aliikangiella sp. G2MR2-5]